MTPTSPPPGYALLTASMLRVVDLYDTAAGTDSPLIVAPECSDSGAVRLELLHAVLSTLDRLSSEGSAGYVSLDALEIEITPLLQSACTREDLRFVCRFMQVDREAQYIDPSSGQRRTTRQWTRLLTFDARRDRVRITDAGHVFLQLGTVTRSWLYEDQQAAKVVRALRLGQFEEARNLALDNARALRRVSTDLTRMMEAPTFDELAQSYAGHRDLIDQMLSQAIEQLIQAKTECDSDALRRQYERYVEVTPVDHAVPLAAVVWAIDHAHQAAESASRTWLQFLQELQRGKRRHLGLVDFEQVLARWLERSHDDPAAEVLFSGSAGWGSPTALASCLDFASVLSATEARVIPAPVVFDCDPATALAEEMHSWLDLHATELLERLQGGPVRLSELLQDPGSRAGTELEHISAGFSVLSANGLEICRQGIRVHLLPQRIDHRASDFRLILPDFTLTLVASEEAHASA